MFFLQLQPYEQRMCLEFWVCLQKQGGCEQWRWILYILNVNCLLCQALGQDYWVNLFFILLGDFETWLYVKEPGEETGPKHKYPKLRPITFFWYLLKETTTTLKIYIALSILTSPRPSPSLKPKPKPQIPRSQIQKREGKNWVDRKRENIRQSTIIKGPRRSLSKEGLGYPESMHNKVPWPKNRIQNIDSWTCPSWLGVWSKN